MRTLECAYLGQLIHFVLPLKQRLLGEQLTKDTTQTPHIHRSAVLVRSEQQLRRSIPQRDDQLRELRRRIPIVSGHAEIRNLDLSAVVHEDVRGLQVAMQDPIAVEVVHRGGELEQQGLGLGGEECFEHVLLQRLEVVFEEVHDKEDSGLEN